STLLSADRSSGQNWSRHQRRFPPDTNPGFSSSQQSGSPCGWHSTSIVGSTRGMSETAQTGSAVPTTSHTSPGANTPAPRVAAISSPQPTTTVVLGDKPVASANELVTVPTAWVPGASSGSIRGSIPAAERTAWDHLRLRGSRSAKEEAFE